MNATDAMGLHDLRPKEGSKRRRRRVGRGRGSGRGKTAGRGTKGAQARAGYSKMVDYEGGAVPLSRKVPKRGFKNIFRVPYRPIHVERLNRFPDGAEVSPETLRVVGLHDGRFPVAILGQGTLERRLTVKAHKVSPAARAAIEAKGGTVEILAR